MARATGEFGHAQFYIYTALAVRAVLCLLALISCPGAAASLWPVPFALWRCVNGLFTKDVGGENHCIQCLSWASFLYLVNAGLSPGEVLAGIEIPGGGGCVGSDRGRGWGRGWVAGRRGYNTITNISLIPPEGFCITMGSGVSPFNVLLLYTRTLPPPHPLPHPSCT